MSGLPDVGVVDTCLGLPHRADDNAYDWVDARTRDAALGEAGRSPVEHLFRRPPFSIEPGDDPVEVTLREMDRHGVEWGMIHVNADGESDGGRAVRTHPDRFIPSLLVDPTDVMPAVRSIVAAHAEFGIRAVTTVPCVPGVAIDDPRMYAVYAKCVELGLPVFVCAGVPGPRLPLAPQKVELIDRVMFDFPELVFVTRHGCEPWVDLAVKLLVKWPNLYYSTSAFAPRYYPRAIIDYANTRGADKVMYAGYFPTGLTFERSFAELPSVPFRDEVWPRFLRDNALRVLGLS